MTFSYFVYKAIGAFLTPPGFFAAAAFLGGVFFSIKSEKKRMISPSSFAFFFAFILYILSLPVTARFLLEPLEGQFPLQIDSSEGRSPVVLVLAGGMWSTGSDDGAYCMSPETLQRFVAGAAAARKMGAALLYSGGHPGINTDKGIENMVRTTAEMIGFPGNLVVEGRSRTTWENLLFSSEIIRRKGWDEVILVTSGFHLSRSMKSAKKILGTVSVRPLSSGRLEGSGGIEATDFLPSPSGLRNTSLALREIAGIIAYALFSGMKD
jgi:uncharacterized SAM-binding protein YcdF (DUF218 family)